MKYSDKFERDYKWYMSVLDFFSFDGVVEHRNKKGELVVQPDPTGVSAKEAFYKYDSEGKIIPTKEPEQLTKLLRTKGSVNLHIKMYAEDRASGVLPKREFQNICNSVKAPDWFEDAVESQKVKYWPL